MSSPGAELQKFIHDTLIADPVVSSYVADRVYDAPPSTKVFPYISFGPSDFDIDDFECVRTRTETVQLDIWTEDQGRQIGAKRIVDAVRDALSLEDASFTDNALVSIEVVSARILPEPAENRAHGIVSVEAEIEET